MLDRSASVSVSSCASAPCTRSCQASAAMLWNSSVNQLVVGKPLPLKLPCSTRAGEAPPRARPARERRHRRRATPGQQPAAAQRQRAQRRSPAGEIHAAADGCRACCAGRRPVHQQTKIPSLAATFPLKNDFWRGQKCSLFSAKILIRDPVQSRSNEIAIGLETTHVGFEEVKNRCLQRDSGAFSRNSSHIPAPPYPKYFDSSEQPLGQTQPARQRVRYRIGHSFFTSPMCIPWADNNQLCALVRTVHWLSRRCVRSIGSPIPTPPGSTW